MDAGHAACHALLPNVVSVRFSEEDARPQYMYVDNGKYRGLVRFCRFIRWPAGMVYAPRGDEEACGGLREGHTAMEDTPPRNRPHIRRRPSVIGHKDGACH